ncbi:50S ribosomal protein L15 [bacterium AB1]|nr:50S ribosomal protein L15 [bacterium AB1]
MSKLFKSKIEICSLKRPESYVNRNRHGRGRYKGNKSGRGSDGQKVRSSNKDRSPKTEGGQFPSHLRVNKVGFYSHLPKYAVCSLDRAISIAKLMNKDFVTVEDIKKSLNTKKKVKLLNSNLLEDSSELFNIKIEVNACCKNILNFKNISVVLV